MTKQRSVASADACIDGVGPILRTFVRVVERYRQQQAERHGVDESALICLGALKADGPLAPGDIAVNLGLTTASVSALLDRVETGGFAERTPHPDDRRRVVVTLTDKGVAVSDELHRGLYEAGQEALASVGVSHRAAVIDFLARSTDNVRTRTDTM
ncbi:MAG: MarR family winged helix-turn-helix transcriptional regulator [Mycobacteriales bacterium]